MMIELEYDSETNSGFGFRPALREIRGRFDANRLPEPGHLRKKFPVPIPGQRLGFDKEGCYIRETLYQPEHAETRREIEKTAKLEPERIPLPAVDLPTFAYWVNEALKAGHLRIVAGKMPTVEGEPVKHFHHVPQPSAIDNLTNEFRRLGDLLERALKK